MKVECSVSKPLNKILSIRRILFLYIYKHMSRTFPKSCNGQINQNYLSQNLIPSLIPITF